MSMNTIQGQLFKSMLVSGSNHLSNHHHEIDALNVFPVPDGDTGTNMNLTFSAGVKEASALKSEHIGEITKVLSKGLLMGARGNSGVILSQIFRGFFQSVESKKEISALDFSEAFVKGTDIAYKAVMRPVEGTILTVLRESSKDTFEYVSKQHIVSIEDTLDFMIKRAKVSLENTPNLLPILKEVGVVDSGAAGYVAILEGFKMAIEGNVAVLNETNQEFEGVQSRIENEEFGYCTEFIIKLSDTVIKNFSESDLRDQLARMGDSLVVVQDDDLVKVHVHTIRPGDALNLGQRYGEFIKLKVENMQEQHEHLSVIQATQVKKKYALIAVAAGDGIQALFKEYRVDTVISGGQTMNPSTEDFISAIKQLNAEHIFIFPNNSNIILAAQQAESLLEDQDIRVIPTKTIPQGLSACIMFNPEVDVKENIHEMTEAYHHVKTGSVTIAIKDSSIDGLQISENDYMGILDKHIVVNSPDKMKTIKDLLEKGVSEEDGLITLIIGEDAIASETDEIVAYIEKTYKNCELEIQMGNQPVYPYIFGIE